MDVFIYVLCGADGLVRYVGMTRDLVRREGRYRSRNGGHTLHMRNWLRANVFRLCVIDAVPAERADVAEREWIAHYRALGANLLNYTDGGEGGWAVTPVLRQKLCRAALARVAAQKVAGGVPFHTPEARAKARASLRGLPHPWSAGRFAALNQARRGVPLSSEHRAKLSAAQRGRKHSAATRAALAAAAKRRWEDPGYRAEMKHNAKLGGANPAGRIASANKRRGVALTEEHRAKVSAKLKGRRNPGLAAYWAAKSKGDGRPVVSESG